MSLKLLIDSKAKRVLFAEADKTAVDFLLHILTLPMGTVIRLLTKQQMVGCIGNLYDSIETLDEAYIQTNQPKMCFSNQKSLVAKPSIQLPFLPFPLKTMKRLKKSFTGAATAITLSGLCPICKMLNKIKCVPSPTVNKGQTSGGNVDKGGFVKGVVTYMVMNDLVVKPMSTISSIALLNKLNVKEVGSLEDKVVDLGMDEALELLKTSLMSKTVLTTVFSKSGAKGK